jgi:hypothetical protein
MTLAEQSQASEALQDLGRTKPNGKWPHWDLAERKPNAESAAPENWQNKAKFPMEAMAVRQNEAKRE